MTSDTHSFISISEFIKFLAPFILIPAIILLFAMLLYFTNVPSKEGKSGNKIIFSLLFLLIVSGIILFEMLGLPPITPR